MDSQKKAPQKLHGVSAKMHPFLFHNPVK